MSVVRLVCGINQQLRKHVSSRFLHVNPNGKKAKWASTDSEFIQSPLVLAPSISVLFTDTLLEIKVLIVYIYSARNQILE